MTGIACDVCGKTAKTMDALKSHKNIFHSFDGLRKCTNCKKAFPHEDFSNHECNKFICSDCGKELKTESSLLNHIEKVHNICGNGFIKLSELTFHIDRVHCEPTTCPECGIKVKKLKLHMKTVHTPDELKKFQCKHCGKGFWLQNALDIHIMNMHLKLKPYNCKFGCEISYNDKSNRNHHERRKHGKLFISVEEERMEAKMKLVTRI